MIDGRKAKPEEHAKCPLRSSDVSFCGSSCKYFSSMNQSFTSGNRREFLASGGGGKKSDAHQSWVTYQQWMLYPEVHGPLTAIWENVDISTDDDEKESKGLMCTSANRTRSERIDSIEGSRMLPIVGVEM